MKCCKGEGVPDDCIGFCAPPGPVTKNDIVKKCHPFLRLIVKCWSAGDGRIEFEIIDLLSNYENMIIQMIIMFTNILDTRRKVMKSCSEYDVEILKGDLEHARLVCDLNGDRCLGVEDPGCDGKRNFYLCPKTAVLKESTSSCFYFGGT